MDFSKLAAERFSVRKFSDRPVDAGTVNAILAAGNAAPTACDKQPQKILVVQSRDGLERFRKCTACHFNAPLAMIVCADTTKSWVRSFDGKNSADIDASIVATHLMLQAAELGVGSTWVMYFIPEAVRTEFGLPEGVEPVALLPMGYPADDCAPADLHAKRKPIGETVEFR